MQPSTHCPRGRVDRAGRCAWGYVAALATVALLAGCAALPAPLGPTEVLDTGVEPVELAYPGPTYALGTRDGMLMRAGVHETLVSTAASATWLPNGVAVVGHDRPNKLQLIDPAVGPSGTWIGTGDSEMPSRSVTQINVWNRYDRTSAGRTTAYDLDGLKLWSLSLPDTDNPDATDYNELERNYYGATATIDGVTFTLWHDSSEWYDDGDYGVLRIEDGEMTNVAMNEHLIALYLSADGSGLLALRQRRGDPCGGCTVDQEIVELDHRTGDLVEYGTPDEYAEKWRVAAMDKVGDRVAVRFTETEWVEVSEEPHSEQPTTVQRGTWIYEDGDWSMIEGSETELTWWQGEHRVVARVVDDESVTRNNTEMRDGFDLFWVKPDGTEEPVTGELTADYGRLYRSGQIPGQLLPPA